jgi:hypothetical protein
MSAPVPRAFELPTLFAYILLAAASSAVCVQINVYLGITPNTAVVGVLAAMALGRTARRWVTTSPSLTFRTA